MKTEVITTMEGLRKIRDDWERIYGKLKAPKVFRNPILVRSWWEAFSQNRNNVSLYVIVVRSEDGIVRLIAPLYRYTKSFFGISYKVLSFLVSNKDGKDLDILCENGYEKEMSEMLSRYLIKKNNEWNLIFFMFTPTEGFVKRNLISDMKSKGVHSSVRDGGYTEVVLDKPLEEFLGTLRPRMRTYIRKAFRVKESSGYKISNTDEVESFDEAFNSFVEFHQGRWTKEGQPGAFGGDSRYRIYFIKKLHDMFPEHVRIYSLKKGNKYIGHQVYFHESGRLYLFQEGYNHEYMRINPGTMLRALIFKKLIEVGGYTYDFMSGETFNKRSWGSTYKKHHYISIGRDIFKIKLYFFLEPIHRTITGKLNGLRSKILKA